MPIRERQGFEDLERLVPAPDTDMVLLRTALRALLAVSPLLTGFAFRWWLEWSPKMPLDSCGVRSYALIAFLPIFAAPPVAVGVWSHRSGKDPAVTVWVVVGALFVTFGACALGSLWWFGAHMCGE